jgi:chromosomal replication initiation ATPase DnaA
MTQHWTEAAIAAHLEGKFFRVDGKDKNEVDARRQREADLAKAEAALQAQTAAKVAREVRKAGAFTSASIIAAVACAHRIGAADLVSKSRRWNIIHARQHACALMREFTGLSFQDIAAAVNLVDHSTVHHACTTWKQRGHVYAVEDKRAREMLGVQQ